MMADVRFMQATRVYPGTTAPAVDALDLHIADGEFVVLVGPSGSGKTTALRMLAGLEEVDAGTIMIGDRDVTDVAPKKRDIAMVFQNYALYPYLTVAANIAFPLKIAKVPKAERETRVLTFAVEPQGKVILDTCGGLGYFADCCLQAGATRVISYEKSADVIWLRSLNPWSPAAPTADGDSRLSLVHADVAEQLPQLASGSVDAILHDPPRFGIAGELYALTFYQQLARVVRRNGRLFHYTGTPNKLTSGRDVPGEVSRRLQQAGFSTQLSGDGVLAVRKRS